MKEPQEPDPVCVVCNRPIEEGAQRHRRAAGELHAECDERYRDESLHESEERTRLILENALDAVIAIDAEGRILSWNPQAEAIFGWRQTEVLGRPLTETIIPPAHRDAHDRGLTRYRATGEGPVLNRRLEMTALRRNGTEFPVELAITPVRLRGATVFSAFLRDLTERKRLEDARRQSEASFRLLFANNPLPMWVSDVATLYFMEVNDAAVAHYGYSREEFLRMRITQIQLAEEAGRLSAAGVGGPAEVAHRERRHSGPSRHRLKDGRIRDVEIASHALDFGGRRAELAVTIDVTDLKHAQAAVANSAERLSVLHEIDAAIIAATAPVDIAQAALRRLRDLLGVPRVIVNLFDLPRGEVEWLAAAGRRRIRVGPGIRFPMTFMGDATGLHRGEPQIIDVDSLPPSEEADALRASGVDHYMVVPMIVADELIGGLSFGGRSRVFSAEQVSVAREVAGLLGIALHQARLYEQVKRQAEDLEARVRARTHELHAANQQLQGEIEERRRAEAEARDANQAKSEFLSRMSHELRTPLNGILGFAQLLELDAQTPDERESVGHILKGGRHLLMLINEVLDIARIEAGRLTLSLEPVIASDVIRAALDLVRPQAAARRIRLESDLDGDHWILADRQRLQQVLLNLVSNAVKYNRDGGSVTIRCTEAAPGRVRIAVHDSGRGIAPQMLERLFTPFERLDAAATGVEGTGLGLALSKRLVEAMRGHLTVQSELGRGSVFTIELPRGEASGLEIPSIEAAIPPPEGTRGTVLYIEDNLANLQLVERIVSRRPGLVLLAAMQATRGLELARDHRPDLIILDLHLPDMPGAEALARLQDDSRTTRIPVVILSADATPNQISRLRAQGAHAYLTKPIDINEFLALLDQVFEEKTRGGDERR